MPESNWNPKAEEAFGLALAPKLNAIADLVRAELPPDTDFGILVLVPPAIAGEEGRVLAVTTDRQRVAFGAAQWVLTALER